MLRTLGVVFAAFVLVACPLGAEARPFTVADLLHQETFRDSALDPSGRWFVFERTDPYDEGARFDYDQQTRIAFSRLRVVDLSNPGPARLLTRDPGPGEVIGGFSPSGTRLAIYRLHARSWRLGVVTLATGAVRWFAITPEQALFGRTLQWLDDTNLLVIDRPDGTAPFALREGRISADRLPTLWAASAKGAGAHAISGSGVYATARPRPTPRRLVRLNTLTGSRQVLATGEFTDLEVSPDRSHVALLAAGEDLQPRPDGPAQGLWGIETQASHLTLLELRTGRQLDPCPGCDALPNLLAWSPSGQALLVFTRDPSSSWASGQLLRIDAGAGQTHAMGVGLRPLLSLRPEILHAGWMGEDPIILARPADEPKARADWFRLGAQGSINLTGDLPAAPGGLSALDRDGFTLLLGDAVWRVSADGVAARVPAETPMELHRTLPMAGRIAHLPAQGSWVLSGPAGQRRVERLTPMGATSPRLPAPGPDEVVGVSEAQNAIVIHHVDADGVERLQLLQPNRRRLTLDTINASFEGIDPATVAPIFHRGPDGQALVSWLFLPPARPGPAPPLIVRAYSGDNNRLAPQPAPPERGMVVDVRPLVGHGYAVLVPSLPLPRGDSDPMAGLAERIEAVVEAAKATPGLAGRFDPDRIALWGHSYGAYTVMAAIGQSDRFRAAVAIAGVSDMTAMWSTLPVEHRAAPEEGSWSNWNTGNTESGQNRMNAPPWTDPGRYQRNSPLLSADKIHTPLLLIHGDQDLIPLAGSEAMFSALYRQDKDAMLITYWGEGHILSSPGNVRDFYTRAFAFLDARLAPGSSSGAAAPGRSPEPGPASRGPSSPQPPPKGSDRPQPSR